MITVLIAVVLFGICIFYALMPLFVEQPADALAGKASGVDDRQRAQQALIEELRELELDYELGKLEASTYQAWRSLKEAQLAALLSDKT